MLNKNDMMDMQQIAFFRAIGYHAAILACVVVAFHNGSTERGVCLVAPLAAWLFAELISKFTEVKVFGKPVWVHFFLEMPMQLTCSSLACNFAGRLLRKTSVPRVAVKLTHIWMVASAVKRDVKGGSTFTLYFPVILWFIAKLFPVNRERREYLSASALAKYINACSLCRGYAHFASPLFWFLPSNLTQTDKLDKWENCWNPLRASSTTARPVTANAMVKNGDDWAISSRATWEQAEGSTTNANGPTVDSAGYEATRLPTP